MPFVQFLCQKTMVFYRAIFCGVNTHIAIVLTEVPPLIHTTIVGDRPAQPLYNDLTVLEQGEHLARRQELVGYKPWRPNKGDTMSPLKATSEIAHDIGLTERSAQRRMQVARNIVPENSPLTPAYYLL